MLGLGVFPRVGDRLFGDVEEDALLADLQVLDRARIGLHQDLLAMGVIHLAGQMLECGHQAFRFEDQRPQREQHLADLLGRAPRQFLDLEQLIARRLDIPFHQPPGEVDPHGDRPDRLCRPVVKIARQLLARLLLRFGQILLLLLQVEIQFCVLQRDQRLLSDELEQLDAIRREEGRIRVCKQKQAVGLQPHDQR